MSAQPTLAAPWPFAAGWSDAAGSACFFVVDMLRHVGKSRQPRKEKDAATSRIIA